MGSRNRCRAAGFRQRRHRLERRFCSWLHNWSGGRLRSGLRRCRLLLLELLRFGDRDSGSGGGEVGLAEETDVVQPALERAGANLKRAASERRDGVWWRSRRRNPKFGTRREEREECGRV